MVSQTFSLQGSNIENKVSQFVRQYYQQAHESQYPGGFIRLYEDYSFMMGNDMVVCLRVDNNEAADGIIKVEIISGGANDSIISLFGNVAENGRITRFKEKLLEFCKENNFNCHS